MALSSTTKSAGDTITAAERNAVRKDIVEYAGDYVSSTGSGSAYLATVDSQWTLTEKAKVKIKASFTCGEAPTLNVTPSGSSATGALALVHPSGNALLPGDILSGQIFEAIYNGTNYTVISRISNDGDCLIGSFTFGEAVDGTTTPQAVYLKASDGKVYKTDADAGTESTYKFIGFTKRSNSANAVGPVVIAGIVKGFPAATFTVNSDLYLSDSVGAVSHTPSTTNSYKVARAITATALIIEKGVKVSSGTLSVDVAGSAGSGTVNTDNVITVGFRAKMVELYYYLQGHGAASGSAKFEFASGTLTYIEGVLIGDYQISIGGASTANSDNADIKDITIKSANIISSTPPTAGVSSGTGAISATPSLVSPSDTGFTIRLQTITSTAVTNHARLVCRWKATA